MMFFQLAIPARIAGFESRPWAEEVKYILLGGGKASTELAARLPAAEVLEQRERSVKIKLKIEKPILKIKSIRSWKLKI